jgi:hypothetical protein
LEAETKVIVEQIVFKRRLKWCDQDLKLHQIGFNSFINEHIMVKTFCDHQDVSEENQFHDLSRNTILSLKVIVV